MGSASHEANKKNGWQLGRALRMVFGIQAHARSKSIRLRVFAAFWALCLLVSGSLIELPGAGLLAEDPLDMDLALRSVSLGWVAPNRATPMTIVDIDDATYRQWGEPLVTPREVIVELLETVRAARPAAVVLDVDFSGGLENDRGLIELREYLRAYDGAVLVLPKRLELDNEGVRRLTASALDEVVASHSKLAWAHANFTTGRNGVVRYFDEWIYACESRGLTGNGVALPSISMYLRETLGGDKPSLPTSVAAADSCERQLPVARQRVLVGPRMTGERRAGRSDDVAAVSAALLLDPELARDDEFLFAGRIVFIGATHSASRDFWLTTSGVLPGIELVANTVRYAQFGEEPGVRGETFFRVLTLALFASFLIAAHRLRALVALAISMIAVLLVVFLATRTGYLRVFDAIETAILLFVLTLATKAIFDLVEDIVRACRDPSHERSRFRRALSALVRAEE